MRKTSSPLVAIQLLGCTLLFFVGAFPQAQAYDIVNRWSSTQLDGGGLQRGDPVNLRWSVVPDGHSYERSSNSELIDFLDDGWNVPSGQRGFDFTNREWWEVINNAYAQYARVSGVTLTYVPELHASGASTGIVGDIRIGGENINNDPGGALADNTFPDAGDMRIDTARGSNGSVGSAFSTEPGLRNLVIHETGHGVGLGHTEPLNNSAKAVMEGGLRTDIWGLQFDDVYALNRQYGDPEESNGGNDSYQTATDLGSLGSTGRSIFGTDASNTSVDQFDGDWLGIDGKNDSDWYKFTITDETVMRLRVSQIGPTYETTELGVFDASAQNDLVLQFFSFDGSLNRLAIEDDGGIGVAETVESQYLVPGDYYIYLRGKVDANQFYRMDVILNETNPNADFDIDGDVDLDDLDNWVAGFGVSSGATTTDGDTDKDGDVDGYDFLGWQNQYGLSINTLSTLQPVPEPQSLALILAAATLGLALPARRR